MANPAGLYPKIVTPIAVLGSAIVFLLVLAGVGNLLLSHAPVPDALRMAAVIAHLSTIFLALPLGISQLVLPKGTLRHRTVGYVWCALMGFTALISFGIHEINPKGFSPIHILSALTLVLLPVIIFTSRTGRVAQHQRTVLGTMIGALVIAGLFTFIPGRALGELVARLFNH